MPWFDNPTGCSLGFIDGLGSNLTEAQLEKIEQDAMRRYPAVTALFCTTSKYHNSPKTIDALKGFGFRVIAKYASNGEHPGMVRIWLKKLSNGVAR